MSHPLQISSPVTDRYKAEAEPLNGPVPHAQAASPAKNGPIKKGVSPSSVAASSQLAEGSPARPRSAIRPTEMVARAMSIRDAEMETTPLAEPTAKIINSDRMYFLRSQSRQLMIQ